MQCWMKASLTGNVLFLREYKTQRVPSMCNGNPIILVPLSTFIALQVRLMCFLHTITKIAHHRGTHTPIHQKKDGGKQLRPSSTHVGSIGSSSGKWEHTNSSCKGRRNTEHEVTNGKQRPVSCMKLSYNLLIWPSLE